MQITKKKRRKIPRAHLHSGSKSMLELLRDVAAGVSAATGERFFQDLTAYLVRTLHTEYAFVGAVSEDSPDVIQTISVCRAGEQIDNFRYALEDTPCARVLDQGMCLYPRHVRKLFPRDSMLIEMGAEAYLGVHLLDSHDRVIGLMVLMDTRPMNDLAPAQWLLQIFAARAAAELERRRVDAELRFRLAFEQLTSDISARFINLPVDKIDGEVTRALRVVGEFTGVDHCYVYECSHDCRHLTNTHEWSAPGVSFAMPGLYDMVVETFPWAMRQYARGETLVISDIDELPAEAAAERAELERRHIKSLASVPLVCAGRLFGVIGLDTVHRSKQWDHDTVALLEAVGRNLASLMARQRADMNQRTGEQRLEAILDNGATLVYVKDLEGRYLLVNREFERLFNVKREQLIGKTDYDVFPREFADRFRANDKKLLASREPVEFEELAPLADGTHTYVSNKFCLYNSDGEPYATCGISTDITERARKVMQQEEFLQLSQRAAHVGSWEWDVATGVVRWSEEMYRIHGVGPEEFAGTLRAYLALVHRDDRPQIEAQLRDLMLAGGEFKLEYRIVRPDGVIRFIASTAAFLKSENDGITRAFGIMQDVTEHKRAEDALRHNEARLRAAQELARLGYWEWDIANDVVYWSDELYRIFGLPRTKAPLGVDDYIACVHADDRAAVRQLIEAALEHGTPYQSEHRAVRPDGEERFVACEGGVVRNARGDVERLVGTARDITEKRRAEEEMRKLSSAMRQTADAVMITGRNGVIEYVNRAFEEITGFCADEALGQRPSLLKSGMHDTAFYQRMWETILRGETFREIFINRRKTGELYHEEKTITPLTNEHGVVTHFISTGKDITERVQAQQRLQFLAHHDPLTRLPNRILFLDRLHHAIARAHRHSAMLSVMFIDLDRFKNINDSLGHNVGDHVLQVIARRLSDAVREGDTVARLGGDEFAVLIEDISHPEGVSPTALKLLDSVGRPYVLNNEEFYLTGSIGISVYPSDGRDAQALLRHADAAMYRAKELGKNNFQFYSADMGAINLGRLTLETGLRRALERNEFRLLYQPQYDLRTGTVIGIEALLRWQHPELGLIEPAQFIAIAEETGLIVPIGTWVARTACAQIHSWHAEGIRGIRLAINVSARQLVNSQFLDFIQSMLRECTLDPTLLELEITESVMMIESTVSVERLRALRALGVRLALDDFGTGYSSLSYLQRFPISTLKIDKAFISELDGNVNAGEIVKAIVGMGHGLGLQVVAEGVETFEVLELVRGCGCDGVQGYIMSRPIGAAELRRLLA